MDHGKSPVRRGAEPRRALEGKASNRASEPHAEIERFREIIRTYFRRNGRQFPWRETRNPYHILVSEFMLQQTQTDRVLPRYTSFLARFPTVDELARAGLRDVLAQWQGLGYNRRARFLHETAKTLRDRHGGVLPDDPELLVKLPGIGPGTAGALAAFAYGRPVAFIETNIRRVFLHFFFPHEASVPDRDLFPLIERSLDREHPREWYYALMDYGVYIKTLFPNPNRRSAHYSVQSPFEGSNRQIRGAVLRILTDRESAAVSELAELSGKKKEDVLRVVDQLAAEGFITAEEGTRYRII